MHLVTRLIGYLFLLMLGILPFVLSQHYSDAGASAEEVLLDHIPGLEEIGFFRNPNALQFPELVTDFSDHWLRRYDPDLFIGLDTICILDVRKDQPLSGGYYPETRIEIWVYESADQSSETVDLLDGLQETLWVFKSPTEYWSSGNWLFYVHTGAEIYRSSLEEIVELLQKDS